MFLRYSSPYHSGEAQIRREAQIKAFAISIQQKRFTRFSISLVRGLVHSGCHSPSSVNQSPLHDSLFQSENSLHLRLRGGGNCTHRKVPPAGYSQRGITTLCICPTNHLQVFLVSLALLKRWMWRSTTSFVSSSLSYPTL